MNPERVQFIIPFQDRFNKNPASIFRSIYFLNLQISICITIRYINGKSIELILYSCLIFTDIPETPVDAKETVQAIVIANVFLKHLGDCYPNLKVALPIEES